MTPLAISLAHSRPPHLNPHRTKLYPFAAMLLLGLLGRGRRARRGRGFVRVSKRVDVGMHGVENGAERVIILVVDSEVTARLQWILCVVDGWRTLRVSR